MVKLKFNSSELMIVSRIRGEKLDRFSAQK